MRHRKESMPQVSQIYADETDANRLSERPGARPAPPDRVTPPDVNMTMSLQCHW
jgi:hypothetical protein